MRPLDFLPSIKLKLGAIIVAAVGVATLVIALGVKFGVWPYLTVAAAGLIALGMVQLLARGMISPLREMADATKAMARGDYDRRVRTTSRDEVGDLARAFNQMAADLGEVDRIRKDLIATVSHELRTPITALRAALENLVDGVADPDPEQFRTMLDQVERLGSLVSQLLDLSRLESGDLPLDRRHFEVRPFLEQAVREQALHTPEGVHLIVDTESDWKASGDPDRLHQVVANLLENAVRHSPDHGTVTVSARPSSDGLCIEVLDEGPGIPPEEASRVFERFYRSGAGRAGDGGTGLGLAIARWVVDLHGGEIRAAGRNPTGCRMVVTLPEEGTR